MSMSNYRIIELLRLEKTFEIKSNHEMLLRDIRSPWLNQGEGEHILRRG